MGEGIPRKTESHTIHEDGTYSNQKSVVASPPAPKQEPKKCPVELGQLVSFGGPYAGSGYVYQIEDGGFWTRPRADFAPDLMECNFWKWEYVNQYLKR